MKALRVYLKQPSPQWLDYTLRMVTLYSKRTDYSQTSGTPSKGVTNAFDSFKTKLNANLKGLKKSTKNADESNEQMTFNSKALGSAIHAYDENTRKLELA